MQATATSPAKPKTHETAALLGALVRYVFQFEPGEHLRAIEESGLSLTQCKALILLNGPANVPGQASELSERLGVSVATVSRAVDGLVKKKLVTRVEDAEDRRVRRLALSAKGRELADELIATRLQAMESFVDTLTPAQRRKLDSGISALLDREELAAAYEQLKKVRA